LVSARLIKTLAAPSIGSHSFAQLDQFLACPGPPLARTALQIGDDEADVEAEPRRLDGSNGGPFAIAGFGSMPRLSVLRRIARRILQPRQRRLRTQVRLGFLRLKRLSDLGDQ
jgi:hypothetical protein